MLLENFLKKVLPNEGFKCWVEISKDKKVTQGLVPTIEELAAKLREIDSRGADAYFGCAAFISPQNRRAGNAGWVRAFWADIDVGEGKPYATQDEALDALAAFCDRCNLDFPGTVNSGGGIHAYWVLDRTLNRDEWLPAAQRFKLLMQAQGLLSNPSDLAVTGDIARILRAPGTKNYKLSEARPVEVIDEQCFEEINADEFIASLGTPVARPAGMDPVPNLGSVNNNLSAGISKAFDATKGVSRGSRGSTLLKYAGEMVAKGWPEDVVIEKSIAWNALCTPPDDEKEVRRIVRSAFTMHAQKHPLPPLLAQAVAAPAALPELPYGYRWGNNNALTVRTIKELDDGKKEEIWEVVSPLPVFLKSILNEEGKQQKNSYLFCQFHSLKGWQEFALSAKELNGPNFYGEWSQNGGELSSGMDKHFKIYIREASNMLRKPGNEAMRYSQFGWKDDDTAFLVGENLYREDGSVEKAYGTDKLSGLMLSMRPSAKTSLADWSAAANKLFTPGMEAHSFMLLLSFAAPLMKFCVDSGNGGAIVSVISEESGKGKTPMAEAVASVWGNMQSTIVTGSFTENRRMEDLVRHCHLVQVQEEMAYGDPLIAAQSVERFTSGSDRGRLNQSGAATGMPERYQTIAISISNKSLYKLVKSVNIPMSRRILEIEIDSPEDEIMDTMGNITREMMRSCGHAGQQFIRYIVSPQVRQYLTEQLTGVNGQVGLTVAKYRKVLFSKPEDRFIVWLLAAAEVGAVILNGYGMLQFDTQRIMDWAATSAKLSINSKPDAEKLPAQFNQFLNDHLNCCLTVRHAYKAGQHGLPPVRTPRDRMAMRLEMDSGLLYVSHAALDAWCTKYQMSFASFGKKLTELKVVLERSKLITLSAGTEIPGARELCWVVDLTHPTFSGALRLEMAAPDKIETA